MSIPKFKIVILGDSDVGKSCFLRRFTDDAFTCNHISTIGVDVRKKEIETEKGKCLLQLWDTAGQEKFRSLSSSYLRNTDGVVLIFDITKLASFEHVNIWMETIKQGAVKTCGIILVGNKFDLEESREVEMEDAKNLASKYGVKFLEASAKNGVGVKEAFYQLAELIFDKSSENKGKGNNVKLESDKSEGSGSESKRKRC